MSSFASLSDSYVRRVIDDELDELIAGLAAIAVEGPKGVGKTASAARRALTIYELDDPATLAVIEADATRLAVGDAPILVDEWQRYPSSWDVVRRAVDQDNRPGRFLLTGSATPQARSVHSGAGRIVKMRMRPQTLGERGIETASVSVAELLTGALPALTGTTDVRLDGYVTEILAGGFPGMRSTSARVQRASLDGYLDRILDVDLPEIGVEIRRPATMRRWLAAYAAATATAASYEKIRDAATAGDGDKPAKTTTIPYREALERIWILEPLDAWVPSKNHLMRLTAAPKHHLVDPALAARLVGASSRSLLAGKGPTTIPRDGPFLGALFESLAALSLRVFAQASESRVFHFRTRGGEREVDFIVERDDGAVLAIEVKLSETVHDSDVGNLKWLRDELGDQFIDALVVTTGRHAYRRPDGIGVVPLALLGP